MSSSEQWQERELLKWCGFVSQADVSDPALETLVKQMISTPTDVFGGKFDGWATHWSRRWEFPFTYFSIQRYLRSRPPSDSIRILESGCGVTPLPFWLSGFGRVEGVDLDEKAGAEWAQSRAAREGRANFTAANMEELPYGDATFDVGFSVSAVEHTSNPVAAVSELIRVIKIGGCFALTMDVRIDGDHGIAWPQFSAIQQVIAQHLDSQYPPRWLLPDNLLTSRSAASMRNRPVIRRIGRIVLDNIARRRGNEFAIWCYAGIRVR